VGAGTTEITGAPNLVYVGLTGTDANGVYSMIVPNGSNYILTFNPPFTIP
jgi:hypothetical protein